MNLFYTADSFDPYRNLAAEELMYLAAADAQGMTLFLWQNENTVVIGRHQNAWRECRTHLLEQEGGKLARRTTGGGAVFHDMGNLNFTFACARENYDLARQTSVILAAVRALGVDAAFTGRNDLVTSSGAKFSGNAFRFSKTSAMQHGTLLVSADMQKLSRYLAPSKEKLHAKGVESVRARVQNLNEFGAHITVDSLRAAVEDAFYKEYGGYEKRDIASLDAEKLTPLEARNASWEWRMGASPSFDITLETRFPWGSVELMLDVRDGEVTRALAFSDAMDEAFISRIAPALTSAAFTPRALSSRINSLDCDNTSTREDIAGWILAQSF